MEKNEKLGRYAVASQDVKAGDVIFSELPFAYGPKSGKSNLLKQTKINRYLNV